MALALVLGMGLPTPAAYILGALTLGHFLQETGIKAIPAHFFIQYFAVFSALTPPVALASMAAAKVSKARFVETAIESIKLVLPAFFVPFAFIFHPELLAFPKLTLSLFITMGVVIGVQWSWSIGIYGFLGRNLNVIERGIFFSICAVGVLYLFRPNLIFLYFWGRMCLHCRMVENCRGRKRSGEIPFRERRLDRRTPGCLSIRGSKTGMINFPGKLHASCMRKPIWRWMRYEISL
jgi:TRAP-type uncharacterized transport system fused permease subunit